MLFLLRPSFLVLSVLGAVFAQSVEPPPLKEIPLPWLSPEEEGVSLALLQNALEIQKGNHPYGKENTGDKTYESLPKIDINPMIIGGNTVQTGEYPWFVMLLDSESGSLCGGFLIAPQFVLTAAHCLGSNAPTAFIGAVCLDFYEGSDGNVYWPNCNQEWEITNISMTFTHPNYDASAGSYDYDFALLKLAERSAITPVKIDSGEYSPNYTDSKDNLWAIGFGRTNGSDPNSLPDELKHVELNYKNTIDCQFDYLFVATITDQMMCATDPGQAACNGDSGGPLYDSDNDVVVGVVSFGVDGCVNPDFPGVYFRIASQFEAIQATICSDDSQASICSQTAPGPTVTGNPTKAPTPPPTKVPTPPPTKAPTPPPTKAPAKAPTQPCDSNETSFEVDITVDAYPEELSWTLTDVCSGDLVLEKSYKTFTDFSSETYSTCIPKGKYIFVLSDSYGDGFGSTGKLTMNYDGGELEMDISGNFGSSTRSSFGEEECPRTPVPTEEKTNIPTKSPTRKPIRTRSPTKKPVARTSNPTMIPTHDPTSSPTESPTSAPSFLPTTPDCDDNDASLRVDIRLDAFPDDTSWNLTDVCSGELVFEKSYKNFDGTSDVYSSCIPNGRYIFVLSDSYGDGLGSPGRVTVNYDGGENELDVSGNFGKSASATFGEACPTKPVSPPTNQTSCDAEQEMRALVIVKPDDYPQEISWEISDPSNRVLVRNSLLLAGEVNHQEVCLLKTCGDNGDYNFVIRDSYGDGILKSGYFKLLVDGMRLDDLDEVSEFSERSIPINGCPSDAPLSPCTDSETEVNLVLKTDSYHTETSFEIRQERSDVTVIPLTKPRSPQRIMKETFCLESTSNYLFHLYDSGGDGLQDTGKDWDFSGHFKLYVNGKPAHGSSDGTDFGFKDTVVINTRNQRKGP